MLDIHKIPNLIKMWCEDNLSNSFEIKSDEILQRYRFFVVTEDKKIQLDFIKCSNGLFTITYKVGTEQSLSLLIAEYIYSHIGNSLKESPYANGFSIIMSQAEVKAVIGLLK